MQCKMIYSFRDMETFIISSHEAQKRHSLGHSGCPSGIHILGHPPIANPSIHQFRGFNQIYITGS